MNSNMKTPQNEITRMTQDYALDVILERDIKAPFQNCMDDYRAGFTAGQDALIDKSYKDFHQENEVEKFTDYTPNDPNNVYTHYFKIWNASRISMQNEMDELKNKLAEKEALYVDLSIIAGKFHSDVGSKDAQIKILKEALEFYGNALNWSKPYMRQGKQGYQVCLHIDGGSSARHVLKKLEEMK